MAREPIRGRRIRWSFEDGPMAGKSFEHVFDEDGWVTFRMLGVGGGKASPKAKYEVALVAPDVHAIAYLGGQGYTLTVVLNSKTGRMVAFGSNEKVLTMQHGTFEVDDSVKARDHGASTHAS